MKKFAITLTVLALLTAACDVLDPPRWGSMTVLVTDEADQPVAGVAVTIWDSEQIKRGGETNDAGIWREPNLRKGHYRVEAEGANDETCRVEARETNRCRLIVKGNAG